ncbi:MAG: fumarylacetoacetate hydrolase family protein [Rhodospirillales bacterium]|nr:fumarylacetoacetate hydrolase family protein [Rhodospirillales bacterium]
MKLVYFDDFKLGVMNGDKVVDVSNIVADIPHTGPHNLISGLIEQFADYKAALEVAATGRGVPISDVRIRPPLPKPYNIDCMAVNYMENGTRDEPAAINAFLKSPNAIIGNGDTMVLPDVPATIFEGEAELALVIGTRAANVSQADAMDYVFGYTNFIDGSARGLGPGANTFYMMKSRETYAPIGPYIVTKDEIDDPQSLDVKLWVNGDLKQDFNTDDMAHKIPRIVEWVSSIHTLEPGDIIATGTNHRGLSSFQGGDKVELEVEGLGRLSINIQDDLNRTWARTTRLEHADSGAEGVSTPQLTGKYAPS